MKTVLSGISAAVALLALVMTPIPANGQDKAAPKYVAPRLIRFWLPGQHSIGRIDHARRASLQNGTILGGEDTRVENSWIRLAGAPKVA